VAFRSKFGDVLAVHSGTEFLEVTYSILDEAGIIGSASVFVNSVGNEPILSAFISTRKAPSNRR